MDLFYGLRSFLHHAKYTVGKESILRGGVPQCDLTPKDKAYFQQLAAKEKQLHDDELEALQALASGQNYHAKRIANWGQYHAINDGAKVHRLGTKLNRQITQAQHQGQILELKRSHKELLAANRMANDRMKWTTVDTTAQAQTQANAQEQSAQWGNA
jgi:hypothetical protein